MSTAAPPSARRTELLEAAYSYVLTHGLTDLSLRPLAAAIGSSPRVLLYLFGSKDGLVRELLARARTDELTLLSTVPGDTVDQVWSWFADPSHRSLLVLWVEAYARSLLDPTGPWAGFAQSTVDDWLAVLTSAYRGKAERTLVLAVLRGLLLDLLATGDVARTTAALHTFTRTLGDSGLPGRA